MKDGAELKEDSRVVVNRDFAPHGSYEITIHKVGDADAGQYTAVASNTVGKEECSCQVSVKDAKDVFALLKGHERKVTAGEEPTFTWFKAGEEFDPQDRFKVILKDTKSCTVYYKGCPIWSYVILLLTSTYVRPSDHLPERTKGSRRLWHGVPPCTYWIKKNST